MSRRKSGMIAAMLAIVLAAVPVSADTLDYEGAVTKLQNNNELTVMQNYQDADGNQGKMVIMVEDAYAQSASLAVKATPDSDGKTIKKLSFGQKVSRVGVCDNGWSKVLVKDKQGNRKYGYVESYYLSDSELLTEIEEEELTVTEDAEVLDFPGTRNGLEVGKVVATETVVCTAMCTNEWSRVRVQTLDGGEVTGFLPNNVLKELNEQSAGNVTNATGEDDLIEGEAVLQPGSGNSDSIWAKAAQEVSQEADGISVEGVLTGDVVTVSADATLVSLGTFRITHYCPCSICCGPWANGITATGVTAQTNHTIAVQPGQIPYGSKVVIGNQVFVAEDCGGGIKDNCIDVYVATHEEAMAKGVYYTDVYLVEE